MLNQTADDATRCLKQLKKNLSNYDGHHGNHFVNTATSYMRSDMRAVKDTSVDLKHVAHQIKKSPRPSEFEVTSARSMMGATKKAMNVLKTTARNSDQKNDRSTDVKGVIDNVVGGNDHKDNEAKGGGLFGKDSNDQDAKHAGLLGKRVKEKEKESKGVRSLFGKSDNKEKEPKGGGLIGKSDKDKDANHGGGILGNKGGHYHHHQHGGSGILGRSDTVEELVKTTLRDNFNVSALSHQIMIAEKSLSVSPSFVERAKEAVNEVKDKLKRDKSSSPTRDGHHAHKHAVTP
ncbi:hypothetical protein PF005_g21099 [Phytophthora fragariae]|uniref:Uncharacterized protein n=1 Tax=Phytophthora fragariae TaxID=53985 RepID=A0A6A4CKC6_9STRA|nr:hypothetical protein PF003_g30828 [Phytophthora fragariae]KAE8986824.1 hypothetical protein PF011_g19834 [Phytophthora fragariae]KAE9084759.1 hypothetical protein PF010_g20708 [Phytophthora fragariae]KAE9108970.1 hypothetical protein PF007_g12440 [Phytophthora fragariae]KAE9185835.1 hypothetical protein PF005_g21099 [Phytophthora fragariae]